ncbi:hypothetical protein BHM03_00022744, partial [Ensete ventricosum]
MGPTRTDRSAGYGARSDPTINSGFFVTIGSFPVLTETSNRVPQLNYGAPPVQTKLESRLVTSASRSSSPRATAIQGLSSKRWTPRQRNGKAPYRPVHTCPIADRYADRSLPGGTAKISRQRLISVVVDRFRLSAVDFDCQRSIDGEIDCRRSIEEEKGKRRKKKYLAAVLACMLPVRPRCPRVDREPSLPARRRRPRCSRATIVPARGDETPPHARRETLT